MGAYKSISGEQVVYGREFIRQLAERTGMEYGDAEKYAEGFFVLLYENLCSNRSVCFKEFGTFGIRVTDSRTVRNPKSMEEYMLPAGYKPDFKACGQLRRAVDRGIKEKERGKAAGAETAGNTD